MPIMATKRSSSSLNGFAPGASVLPPSLLAEGIRAFDDGEPVPPADGSANGVEHGARPMLELRAGESEAGNTLQAYLREIRKAPLFTPEEEFDTATRARAGDFPARQ